MAVFKCKMCGGSLEVQEGMTVCECEYCGSMQTVPSSDDEKLITLFTRANRLRSACEFDKAAGVYETLVAEYPEEAEAYWGLILCKYGIEYVDDPRTGKKIPTCHRSSFDSVMDDSNFEMVMEYSDPASRAVYRDEAKAIESLRVGIIEVSSKEEPYDIFICYKETDAMGERTIDSVIAQDVYDALSEKGYKVFFSRITLEDKLGQEYEPYIFAALNSAKVMLAFGTDYEYYNAVWVKNEWSRFLSLIAKGEKKTLIPCYKGIDAYDMPKEFAKLQAQDMGKIGAIQDLLRGIEKVIGKKQIVVEASSASGTSALTKRGYIYLEDKDYEKSLEYFEKALDENPEDADAYLGKVFVSLKIHSLEELEKLNISLELVPDFCKAVRYSTGMQQARLNGVLETNKKQIGDNKELVERVQTGTQNDLLTITPLLISASKYVDDADIMSVFGISRLQLNNIILKYEIYKTLIEKGKPLNTKDICKANSELASKDVNEVRTAIVALNHAGFIDYVNKRFIAVSDEYRAEKNTGHKDILASELLETEQTIKKLKDRSEQIPQEIEHARIEAGNKAEQLQHAKALAEEDQSRILDEIEREKKTVQDDINERQKNLKDIDGQISTLNTELSGLGIFQGKRKKEVREQIANLEDKKNQLVATIGEKQNMLNTYIAEQHSRITEIMNSIGNTDDPDKQVTELEMELDEAKSQIGQLMQKAEQLKQEIEEYQWKPEWIEIDYDDSELKYRFKMPVDDVFTITGRGTVATGRVEIGNLKLHETVTILRPDGSSRDVVVTGIEAFRKIMDSCTVGDNVGLLLRGVAKNEIRRGDILGIVVMNITPEQIMEAIGNSLDFMERVCGLSDDLMMKYLEGDEPTIVDICAMMKNKDTALKLQELYNQCF